MYLTIYVMMTINLAADVIILNLTKPNDTKKHWAFSSILVQVMVCRMLGSSL